MPIELDVEAMRNRVISLRTARTWTQADLARESGISQATVSMIENGVRRVNDLGTAVRLANTFGLSMDEFLGHARPASDSLLGLKKRYAELQRAEWTAWAHCERAQAEFFRAEKRGATQNDRRFGETASDALRAWVEAHRLTREAANAMLTRARENASRGGWDINECSDMPSGRPSEDSGSVRG
jgi:transcriptional regulator with XRE-family HTH domain